MFLLIAARVVVIATLVSACGAAVTLLGTKDDQMGPYFEKLYAERDVRLIAHFELGYRALARFFGEHGIFRTLVSVFCVYAYLLPPLALLFIPTDANFYDNTTRDTQIERQWMLVAALQVWLWGNVLLDTLSFVTTRNIARELVARLRVEPRKEILVAKAVLKNLLVSFACLYGAAYATAVAFVLELKQANSFCDIFCLTPADVLGVMLRSFRVLGHPVPFPPHLVVAATSYLATAFLFTSFAGLALASKLVKGLPLVPLVGARLSDAQTTRTHVYSVLGIIVATCGVLVKVLF